MVGFRRVEWRCTVVVLSAIEHFRPPRFGPDYRIWMWIVSGLVYCSNDWHQGSSNKAVHECSLRPCYTSKSRYRGLLEDEFVSKVTTPSKTRRKKYLVGMSMF